MKKNRSLEERVYAIATDHPFFDVCPPCLSDKEVEAIMAQHPMKTGKEFVDSIYAELGMERPSKSDE